MTFNAIRDNNHTIWGTAEADAWSRDFDYANYLSLHAVHKAKLGLRSDPVSENTYKLLGEAFFSQMVEDFNKGTTEILTTEKELA